MNRNKYLKFVPQHANIKTKFYGIVVIMFLIFKDVHCSTLRLYHYYYIAVCSLLQRLISSSLVHYLHLQKQYCMLFIIPLHVSGSWYHLLNRQSYNMTSSPTLLLLQHSTLYVVG